MHYLKMFTIFWKNKKYASWRKLSENLKNGIEVLVGQAVLELLNNSRTTALTQTLMPFLSFSDNLDNHNFSKKCLIILKQTMTNFGLGCIPPENGSELQNGFPIQAFVLKRYKTILKINILIENFNAYVTHQFR